MATFTPNLNLRKPARLIDLVSVDTDLNENWDKVDTQVAARATTASLVAHTGATTSVHGIADTAQLVTMNTAQLITGLKTISPSTASAVGLIVKGLASQAGNLQEWQDSTGAVLASISAAGGAVLASISSAGVIQQGGSPVLLQSLADAKGDLIAALGDNALTRLAVGTNGHVLTADSAQAIGIKWAALPTADAPEMLDRTTDDLDVVNTTTDTTLYSVTVPANKLSTNRGVLLKLAGDYLNNSGGTPGITFRVKFGGVTVYQDTTIALSSGSVRRSVMWEVFIANQGATNSQMGGGLIGLSTVNSATTGLGDLSADSALSNAITLAASTVDTTVAQTFELSIQHSSAASTISLRRLTAFAVVY